MQVIFIFFYLSVCQTIPAKFVKQHKLFRYEHALVRHKSHRFRFILFQEKHHEDANRVNHVYLKGPWRQLAAEWGLEQNQMLRFKYTKDVGDDKAIVFYGEDDVKIPLFHVC